MNSQLTRKYKQILNDIEKAEASRERFNFSRLEKISREKNRLEKFDKKKLPEKKIKVKISTRSGKKVPILTAQLKKKDTPGKFYKSGFDKKSYFHKQETFLIINRQKIHGKIF